MAKKSRGKYSPICKRQIEKSIRIGLKFLFFQNLAPESFIRIAGVGRKCWLLKSAYG